MTQPDSQPHETKTSIGWENNKTAVKTPQIQNADILVFFSEKNLLISKYQNLKHKTMHQDFCFDLCFCAFTTFLFCKIEFCIGKSHHVLHWEITLRFALENYIAFCIGKLYDISNWKIASHFSLGNRIMFSFWIFS